MTSDKERWSSFSEGVGLVLRSWTALRLAIENYWGGDRSNEKGEELVEDITYWFSLCKQGEPDYLDLQDQLMAAMIEDFNTEVQDGSLLEVATQLVILYKQCKEGNYTLLNRLRDTVATLPTSKTSKVESDSESGSSEEEIEEDFVGSVPKNGPEVDSEGFTIVRRKR